MRIALIGCAKTKRSGVHAAKDLYTSPLFRAAWEYAMHFDLVYILSAKHGLLDPWRRIRSYDMTVSRMARDEQKRWAARVYANLRMGSCRHDSLTLLCGNGYMRDLLPLVKSEYAIVDVPLAGMGIGVRIRWLKMHQKVPSRSA